MSKPLSNLTIVERLKNWLFNSPKEYAMPLVNVLLRYLHQLARILFAVVRDVLSGQISLHAMSLVYTTILSIVPMLALSFSVLKAFNVQDQFTPMLYVFLEPMGEKGIEIYNNVLLFVGNMKVGVLGVVGFVLLFYTVISLIQKIETAFNTIWFAPQLRPLSERFSHYLSVILVGPVLVVAAISLTASTMNSSLMQSLIAIEPFGSVIVTFTKLMPFLMIIAAFTFFYMMMPNTKVNFKSAFVGGLIGGSTWQASSMMFTAFVVNSAKYDAIYSGFAVGILLLIWLYLNWLILLLGSSIAFYHQHGNYIMYRTDTGIAPEILEASGLDLMCYVASRYESDSAPVSQQEIETRKVVPALLSRKIIEKLLSQGLLLLAGEKADCLVPAYSTDKISVADIFKALRQDEEHLLQVNEVASSVRRLTDELNTELYQGLTKISLRDLINEQQNNNG